MKVALYARYSSDQQRDASIADQFRVCRNYAEKQGWQIVEEYSDHAISGASLLRAGVQSLIEDAQRGRFQIVLAEAMDRLSRDQEDIAGFYKRMVYAGVKIITLSEGDCHASACRSQGHDERALPEGPGRQDTPRSARPRGVGQVGRW